MRSGKVLMQEQKIVAEFKIYTLRGLPCGRVPPPRWNTTLSGTTPTVIPASRMRQRKSILLHAGEIESKLFPVFIYRSARHRCAPEMIDIHITVILALVRFESYQNTSSAIGWQIYSQRKPPHAPAYSELLRLNVTFTES